MRHIATEKYILSELNRCIFQISLKYSKLVIPKILVILVLCSFNFHFKITRPPPTPPPTKSKFLTPHQRLFLNFYPPPPLQTGGGAACPALTLCKCNNYQINLLCYSSFPFFTCLYCMGSESELSKHCINSIKKKTMQIISLACFDAHILPMFTKLRIIKFLDLISCNSLLIYKHFPSKSPSVLQMFLF